MSRSMPGEQVEHAFSAHRLCNWEVPTQKTKECERTTATMRFDTLRPATGKTAFIVDDRGHLIKSQSMAGSMKLDGTSFNHTPAVYDSVKARWPQTSNPAIPAYACATMGYKGIKTNYLPTNTVSLKAVEMPQAPRLGDRVTARYTEECNYNFM